MKKMILKVVSLFQKSANWRTLLLTGFGIIYLVIGALIFKSVENAHEAEMNMQLLAQEEELISKYNISKPDYYNMTITILELEPHRAGVQWGFSGAVYFAMTVVTTIGYGHSVPQTIAGKFLCIFYAIFGIPMWLVTFQAMGERINTGAKYLFKIVGHKLGFKFDVVSHKCLIPFGILSCMVTLLVGTIAFAHFENWSYINSAYYCVMTLTTIGFGDYVALQKGKSLKERPQYVTFTLIYIMIGLTVIGAFLNLVILRMMVTLPATPEHSVNGGSKKNSPEQTRNNLSITSRRSHFDDVNSSEDDDVASQQCMETCNQGNCCKMERETCLRNHTFNRLKHEIEYKSCDGCLFGNDGFWGSLGRYKHSKWKENICANCKLHISELCDECRFILLECCNCWNCTLYLADQSRNSQYDNVPSCSNEHQAYRDISSPKVQSYLSSEETKSNSKLTYLQDANQPNTKSEYKTNVSIPEVTVSHIKVCLADSCGSSNSNSNNINFADTTHAPSHFLSPPDCILRRNRYGSGDSGYLGGARSSSSNISHHTDDDSLDCRHRVDSKADFEINTRPCSLPSSFDHLSSSQTFPKKIFKHSGKNQPFSVLLRDSTNPTEFKRKSCTNLQSSEDKVYQAKKLHYLLEGASISCHSDAEVIRNRSVEMTPPQQKVMIKTLATKFLPLSVEEPKKKAETSSLKGLYKKVTLKPKVKRKCSSSFSHQDSNETSVSSLNSGDWNDPTSFPQLSVLETVVDVHESCDKNSSLTVQSSFAQDRTYSSHYQINHAVSDNFSIQPSTIFNRKMRRCRSAPSLIHTRCKHCCAANSCCRFMHLQTLLCHPQAFHQSHDLSEQNHSSWHDFHSKCCWKCNAWRRHEASNDRQQNFNISNSSKHFSNSSSSLIRDVQDHEQHNIGITPKRSSSFTGHLSTGSHRRTKDCFSHPTHSKDSLNDDVFDTPYIHNTNQLYKSDSDLFNTSKTRYPC